MPRTDRRIRVTVNWTLHPQLIKRLQYQADHELTPRGKRRSISSIVEQALAEYLAIPLANPELPEQPLELCPQCEKGILREGACRLCNYHRYPRGRDKHRRKPPQTHNL